MRQHPQASWACSGRKTLTTAVRAKRDWPEIQAGEMELCPEHAILQKQSRGNCYGACLWGGGDTTNEKRELRRRNGSLPGGGNFLRFLCAAVRHQLHFIFFAFGRQGRMKQIKGEKKQPEYGHPLHRVSAFAVSNGTPPQNVLRAASKKSGCAPRSVPVIRRLTTLA